MNKRRKKQTDFPFRVIDLTHPLVPGGPVWPGDPKTTRKPVNELEEGFTLSAWSLGEHTGTHVGTPSHFIASGATIDSWGPDRLVRPLAVLRPGWRSQSSNGRELSIDDVMEDEKAHGPIPHRAAVVLDTGWARRWPDKTSVFETNEKGQLIHPGFGREAAEHLLLVRGASILGTDAPGVDPGPDMRYQIGRAIARANGLHVENLVNLEEIPPRGAWVIIGALPFQHGSGSPARVFALVE